MRRIPALSAAVLVLALALALSLDLGLTSRAAPPRPYQVVSPRDIGVIATAINGRGEIVGFEWVEEADHPGVVGQKPFFARGKEVTFLPLLAGYTATFPAALSDGGLVVGRAGKPAAVGMRNQAFAWDATTGIRGLGAPAGYTASFACGVSRDGRRVSGVAVGSNRVHACVWDLDPSGAWKATLLPHAVRLGTQTVALSGDGRCVSGVDDAAPCLWSPDTSGAWVRETIGPPGSFAPRAVNDAGSVAGVRFGDDGLTHAVVWTRGAGLKTIPEPEGYVRSEANALNNSGAVVGTLDGPQGSKTGPDAFVYENGQVRLLTEGGPNFASATAVNDRRQVAGVIEAKED